MDCNFYFGIVVSFVCGYLGMKNEIWFEKQFKGDVYEGEIDVFCVMGEVLDLFEEVIEIYDILGLEFVCVYVIFKCIEYEEFFQVISLWECEYLLLNV